MSKHPEEPTTQPPERPPEAPEPDDAVRGPMRDATWEERRDLIREGVDEGEGTPLTAMREELPKGSIYSTDAKREPRPHFAVAIGMLAVMVIVTYLSLIMLAFLAGADVTTQLIPGFWFWVPLVVVLAAVVGFNAAIRRWPEGEETWVARRVLTGVVAGILTTAVALTVIGLIGQALRGLGVLG